MATRKTTPVDRVEREEQAPIEKEQPRQVEVDIHQYIPVRNGFNGMLDFLSQRTNTITHWDAFGDVQFIELIDLQLAKSTAKKFYENNWFQFDEDYLWVIEFLGVQPYYQYAITPEEFDEIVRMSPDEVTKRMSRLSKGQKQTYVQYAREKVADGTIDSRKVIAVLEKVLNVDLDEK